MYQRHYYNPEENQLCSAPYEETGKIDSTNVQTNNEFANINYNNNQLTSGNSNKQFARQSFPTSPIKSQHSLSIINQKIHSNGKHFNTYQSNQTSNAEKDLFVLSTNRNVEMDIDSFLTEQDEFKSLKSLKIYTDGINKVEGVRSGEISPLYLTNHIRSRLYTQNGQNWIENANKQNKNASELTHFNQNDIQDHTSSDKFSFLLKLF